MTIATRREWLKTMAALGAGSLANALLPVWAQQPTQDPTAAFRAQIGAVPIKSQPLGENLTLLSGPGGNVVVLHGADGLVMVDTFVAPAWPNPFSDSSSLGHAGATKVSTMTNPSAPCSTTTLPPGPESRVRFSPSCCVWIGTAPIWARNAAVRSCGCCCHTARGISEFMNEPAPSAAIVLSHSRRVAIVMVRLTVCLC